MGIGRELSENGFDISDVSAPDKSYWWIALRAIGLKNPFDELDKDMFEEKNYANLAPCSDVLPDLLSLFADRLKVYLRDRGARHDLVDAVFAMEGHDDLWLIVQRVNALSDFLATDDGANLLAGYKRAANILRIEEKKDGKSASGAANTELFAEKAESDLYAAIDAATGIAREAVAKEDFAGAMAALAQLRGPVDLFFDDVTVNADDPALRENRLKLLAQIRDALHTVADFSKVEG